MPHPAFNQMFLTLPVAAENPDAARTIYNDSNPVYFSSASEADLPAQPNEFQSQYKILLEKLDFWCHHNSVQQQIAAGHDIDGEGPAISTITLFWNRLFGEHDFYSTRKIIFFDAGKKALEQLLLLLDDPIIPLDHKKTIMSNLQESILVCADGTLTNILNARDDLIAINGVMQEIARIKLTTIQQMALVFISSYLEPNQIGSEIHHVNAYCNYVAPQYGIPVREDHFIASAGIPLEYLNLFTLQLEAALSPKMVLSNLVSTINLAYEELHKQISHEFFKGKPFIPFTPDVTAKITGHIDAFNRRYSPVLELSTDYMLEPTDDTYQQVRLLPYNLLALNTKIAAGFRQHFLTEAYQQAIEFNTTDGSKLVYDNGFYWVEADNKINACTPKRFLKLLPHTPELTRHGVFSLILVDMLQMLLDANLLTKEHLNITSQTGFDAGVNAIWRLAQKNQFSLIETLLDDKLLAAEQLVATPLRGPDAGINTIWLLAKNEQFGLLEKLLNAGLLSKEQLAAKPLHDSDAGRNALWLLAKNEQFGLLEKLLNAGLLSAEQLAEKPLHGLDAGMHALLTLITYQQVSLVYKLLDAKLLTQEQLNTTQIPNHPLGATNVVWVLARIQQFDLIDRLLANELLTQEQLTFAPTAGDQTGINTIFSLIEEKQYDLFQKLLDNKLLTQEQLALVVTSEPHAGKNALWLLVKAGHFDLFEQLLKKNLLTPEQLAAAPTTGPDKGMNAIFLLAIWRKFDLIERLLNKNLLTEAHLTKQDPFCPSIIFALASMNAFKLIEKLLDAKLLTKEQLSAVPQVPRLIKKNTVLILLENNQRRLIEKLLDADLLTQEQLSLRDENGKNAIWHLAGGRLFNLIEKMLDKNLLTSAQLMATPLKTPYPGMSVTAMIVRSKHPSLARRLRDCGLIEASWFPTEEVEEEAEAAETPVSRKRNASEPAESDEGNIKKRLRSSDNGPKMQPSASGLFAEKKRKSDADKPDREDSAAKKLKPSP